MKMIIIRFSFKSYDDYNFRIYFHRTKPQPTKNIPALKIGNDVYEMKDLTAREHMIEVRDTKPDSDDNKVWIRESKEVSPLAVEIPGTEDDFKLDLGDYPYMEVGNIQYKKTSDGDYAGVHVVAERATTDLIADLRHEEARLKSNLEDLIVWKKEKARANGVATLDANGLVPSNQLPSYVDDVLEGYVNPIERRHITHFYKTREGTSPNYTYKDPYTPEYDKIYVNIDSESQMDYNRIYRWSGTYYIEISNPKDAIHDQDDLIEEDKYNYTWSIHRLANEFTADRDLIASNDRAINNRAQAIEDDVAAKDAAINERARLIEVDVAAKDAAINERARLIEVDVAAKDAAINERARLIEVDVVAKDAAINERAKAIEDSVGAANGIASLDANVKVPIDQLQNGISDSETVTNKTWSSNKLNTEYTADRDRLTAIENSVGASNGIASLDSNTKVPVDQLQNIIGDNPTATNKTWSANKLNSEYTADRNRIKAIEDAVGAANGIATLDSNQAVPVGQLINVISNNEVVANKTWSSLRLDNEYTADRNRIKAIEDAIGAHSGIATLDANGLVPSSQLPSYVDDGLEYADAQAFPETGETGKIYVALDTNLTYRWSGSAYVEISKSLALGTTSATAFVGDKGLQAYTHAVTNKGSQFASGLYKIETNSEGHVTGATAVQKSDITGLGIPGTNTVTSVAYDSLNKKITQTVDGSTSDVVTVFTLKQDMRIRSEELVPEERANMVSVAGLSNSGFFIPDVSTPGVYSISSEIVSPDEWTCSEIADTAAMASGSVYTFSFKYDSQNNQNVDLYVEVLQNGSQTGTTFPVSSKIIGLEKYYYATFTAPFNASRLRFAVTTQTTGTNQVSITGIEDVRLTAGDDVSSEKRIQIGGTVLKESQLIALLNLLQ